jgi:NAD+ synthase
MKKAHGKLVKGIKQYFTKAGIKKAVIGLSGGIDSALALKLTADAIGNSNVTALLMPEKGLTKKANVEDAVDLCKILKVEYKIIPINSFIKEFKKINAWKQNKIALINTKSRVRALILYNYSNTHNAIVIGTSNKTELKLGYFTKYGDGACDIEVLGDLYKTEVWKLSEYLEIPKNMIHKVPSAELFHGHTDEKEIGENYKNIDLMLKGKKKMSKKVKDRILENKHKTEQIHIIKK